MEEIINIIKEIKEKEKLENNNSEKIKYLKSKEEELLQDFKETRDVYRKQELANEINVSRKNIQDELEKVRNENLKKLYSRLDSKKETLKKQIESNEEKIEELKNMDIREISKNIQKDNEQYENSKYGELLQEFNETKDVYRRKDIIEQIRLEKIEKLKEEILSLKENINDLENRDFEKILKEEKVKSPEQEQKEVQENTIPEQEQKEKTENVTPEQRQLVQKESLSNQTEKQEPAIDPSYTSPLPQEVVIDNEIKKIVIDNLENKVNVNMPNYNISLSLNEISSQEQDLRKALSVDTLNRLEEMQISNTQADEAIIKGLLINEEKLNQYLNMCEKSEKTITKTDKDMYSITMFDFPKIEYKLDNLKKSKLNENQKLEMYKKVKASEKMFKKFGLKNNINIKMSLMDKAYFNVKSLVENLKSTKALKPANRNIIDNQNTVTEPQDNAKQEKSLKERIEFKRDKQAEEDLEYKALKALVDKKQGDKPKDKGQEK